MKELGEEALNFLKKHGILLVYTAVVTVITYAVLLINSEDILTDMETYITYPVETRAVFEQAGRFGLVLTKKLFSTDSYVPVLFICLMMVSLAAGTLFFDFCIYSIVDEKNKRKLELFYFIFNGLFITCPIFIHQFYFYYQSFEITFAFFLSTLAAFCTYQWAYRGKTNWYAAGAIFCMVWSFSTYQVLVPYYIAVNAIFFLFFYLYGIESENYFSICLKVVLIFLVGLGCYFGFSKILIKMRYHLPDTLFLEDSYARWGKCPAAECMNNIFGDFKRVIHAAIPVYNRFYGGLTLLFAGLAIRQGKRTGRKQYMLFVLAILIFIIAPFLMTILLGNFMIVRGQLVYPIVFAATVGLLSVMLWNYCLLKIGLLLMSGVMIFSQMDVSNRYAQTIHAVAEADKSFAHEIYVKKQKVLKEHGIFDGAWVPVVFTGKRHPVLPVSYIAPWDAAGISFFEVDSGNIGGSNRISRLMNCLGLHTAEPSVFQFQRALEEAETMTVWPEDGSCIYSEQEEMLIVKLSEESDP